MSTDQSNRPKLENDPFENFRDFVDPEFAMTSGKVIAPHIRKKFKEFMNKMIDEIPQGVSQPKNPYMFNAHMGDFVRLFTHAKNAYVMAQLAYHEEVKKTKMDE
jgi:hypothetical protein